MSMRGFKGFALMKGDTSPEANLLVTYCLTENIPLVYLGKTDKVPKDIIPCGSVEWCLHSLGKQVIPDYYPVWLSDHLGRKVWRTDKFPLGEIVFIKPADRYKRFTGYVTDRSYRGKKRPPYICSEVVHFRNEWRYYIADGEIISSGWYWGDEVNTPEAPELNINIPSWFCGAVDFGMTHDGRLLLIESQHPFACGWYNKDYRKMVEWLVAGWKYMLLSIAHDEFEKALKEELAKEISEVVNDSNERLIDIIRDLASKEK